jgi:hypothetical protein
MNILKIQLSKKHIARPTDVGIRKESAVRRRLLVSLYTVISEVEQGK